MCWDAKFEELIQDVLPSLQAGESLGPEADLIELGLDSMGTVQLLVAIEEHYEIVLSDDSLMVDTFRTPASLWAVVKTALAESHGTTKSLAP